MSQKDIYIKSGLFYDSNDPKAAYGLNMGKLIQFYLKRYGVDFIDQCCGFQYSPFRKVILKEVDDLQEKVLFLEATIDEMKTTILEIQNQLS